MNLKNSYPLDTCPRSICLWDVIVVIGWLSERFTGNEIFSRPHFLYEQMNRTWLKTELDKFNEASLLWHKSLLSLGGAL